MGSPLERSRPRHVHVNCLAPTGSHALLKWVPHAQSPATHSLSSGTSPENLPRVFPRRRPEHRSRSLAHPRRLLVPRSGWLAPIGDGWFLTGHGLRLTCDRWRATLCPSGSGRRASGGSGGCSALSAERREPSRRGSLALGRPVNGRRANAG
jgi:hypothetical protein